MLNETLNETLNEMLNKALSETLNEKLNEKLNAGSTHGAIAVRMPFDRRANAVRLPSECEEHGRGRRYVLARERCGFGVLSTWRHQKIRNRESEFERESSAMLEFAYKERCPAVKRVSPRTESLATYREMPRHRVSPQSLTTDVRVALSLRIQGRLEYRRTLTG